MSCGLEELVDKAVTSTTKMTFLGVTFDSEKMTLEVTLDAACRILGKKEKKSSLKELQSLLGKLHFIAGCVRAGRIFVSRFLNWLRSAFPSDTVGNKHKIYRYIPTEIKKDLKW